MRRLRAESLQVKCLAQLDTSLYSFWFAYTYVYTPHNAPRNAFFWWTERLQKNWNVIPRFGVKLIFWLENHQHQLPAHLCWPANKALREPFGPFPLDYDLKSSFFSGIVFTEGDFQARSRLARSTIPEEKWGLLVVYLSVNRTMFCRS